MQDQLEKSQAKYKMCHDKHRVSDQVWFYISKYRLKGEGKKLKPIKYGPFKIVENIGNNPFWLYLPPYMSIYSVVNVENLKLYEPSMIIDPQEYTQIPTIDDLALEYMNEFQEDTILDKIIHTSRQKYVEYI